MSVTISGLTPEADCVWCEKTRETVQVTFEDGFLRDTAMCWSCLQKAVRVRSRQEKPTTKPAS